MSNDFTMNMKSYFLLTGLFLLTLPARGQSSAGPDLESKATEMQDSIPQKELEIFEMTEVMPKFPGGEFALLKYLKDNLQYPEAARKNKIQGQVIVKFYVDLDGSIQNAHIIRDSTKGLDGFAEEALRLVHAMPKWTPGRQGGRDVRVNFVLPVSFRLN